MESSPFLYETPLVASPDKNQVPLAVRIEVVRDGQLIPLIEQKEINKLFHSIDQERELDQNEPDKLAVHHPNPQQRVLHVKHQAQPSHCMSTAVDVKPRVPL